ncbi:MAG: glycine zipper 2TM domain-containing protein [Alphaproteobacteria bacterium]|nr:glycine zipper 2TM domain-containing protein [Alphaproteobacteria bacterium]MBV9373345.1 glycine zipper 2TM domain-containing protein [Alphaproteobacteria bacterium]MBV9902614.1 glycine zipper 2TM domain-containing protein [Alphaproteobacteria bacterium]
MRKILVAALLASLPALAAPALAQTGAEQRRWDMAQARFDSERRVYERERDLYERARARDGRGGYDDRYDRYDRGDDRYDRGGAYDPRADDRGYRADDYPRDDFRTDYDAARDYRADARYPERRLGARDEVYRGSDGRYYCRRSDGTIGLLVGGVGGALFGNVVDGGRNRTAGTLIGGALGALVGTAVGQQQADYRCR